MFERVGYQRIRAEGEHPTLTFRSWAKKPDIDAVARTEKARIDSDRITFERAASSTEPAITGTTAVLARTHEIEQRGHLICRKVFLMPRTSQWTPLRTLTREAQDSGFTLLSEEIDGSHAFAEINSFGLKAHMAVEYDPASDMVQLHLYHPKGRSAGYFGKDTFAERRDQLVEDLDNFIVSVTSSNHTLRSPEREMLFSQGQKAVLGRVVVFDHLNSALKYEDVQ